MNKTTLMLIAIGLLVAGCQDENVANFNNGESLKCVKKGGVFSDDKVIHVNNQNSDYEKSITRSTYGKETFEYKEDGVFDTSINPDDCTID